MTKLVRWAENVKLEWPYRSTVSKVALTAGLAAVAMIGIGISIGALNVLTVLVGALAPSGFIGYVILCAIIWWLLDS